METKFKERLTGNSLFGIIKNAKGFYQRITKKFSLKASEVGIANFTHYDRPEVHKFHILEVEVRRAKALAEARRYSLR